MYIECCINIGRTLAAHKGLEGLFRDLSAFSPVVDDERLCTATAHYNLGIIFRASRRLNAAAYSFLQASRQVPVHQSVDEAVDALENMVKAVQTQTRSWWH